MYAAFSWKINPDSVNAAAIRAAVVGTLGDRARVVAIPNLFLIQIASAADFDGLAFGLESLHREFGADLVYVCLRCELPTTVFRPSPDDRPEWDALVRTILQ